MKKLLLFVVMFYAGFCFGQEDAWVYFKDKPDAEFYLAHPLQMLSQKALDRRSKQGISLDNRDVPSHQAYIDGITSAEGITVMARSKWLNALHISGNIEDINALKDLTCVERIDFANKALNANTNGLVAMPKQNKAVNKVLGSETTFSYGNSANQIQMLNGQALHEKGFTGTGMTIAVLDAGFPGVNTTSPFLRLFENNLILGGYNYVSHSEDFYTGGNHGTTVLSTMAGYVEGQLTGTAPDAFYYLFVTEDPGSEKPIEESYWVEAAEKADSLGVDVINTSLGYFKYDNAAYSYTYEDIDGQTAFITRGANIAFEKGIFCVISAGNDGNTNSPHIGTPADAPNALTVGAVDSMENYVTFSSRGPSYDGRIKPDVMARGAQAIIANVQGVITSTNGTSYSSPITAGLVACLWQALPEKTNAELLELIRQSADRYNNPTDQYGYGIPDFNLAMQSGSGVINPLNDRFVLYPNPSGDIVNIVFPKETRSTIISVFNNLGQLVMEKHLSVDESSFNLSSLAIGIYNYKLESGRILQTGRIVKE